MITKIDLCRSSSLHPYHNLALEERLFETVEPGECILYLWQNQRTVVVGRNQNARAQCRVDALEKDGGFLARRLSGGGAVFHDLGNLNFTFLVRDADYDVQKQLSVIARAVARFGVAAEVSGRNDVLADGRKFSGNAFFQHGDRRYHHGTLLVDVDTAQMARYLTPDVSKLKAKGVDSVRSRVVNLKELCQEITVEAMAEAMAAAFGEVYELTPGLVAMPTEAELAPGIQKFGSFAWLYGVEKEYTLQTPVRRFDWGCAQLCLVVENGVIKDATLFTDAMEHELADNVKKALCGARFARDSVQRALLQCAPLCNIEREMEEILFPTV